MDVYKCTYCKRYLPSDSFHKNRAAKNGCYNGCKECVCRRNKEERKIPNNPQLIRSRKRYKEKYAEIRAKFKEYSSRPEVREHMAAYARERRKKSDYCRKLDNKRYYRLKIKALEILGGKCIVCGETNQRVLTFGHKNDDGYLDRLTRKTKTTLLSIINGTETHRFEVQCFSCNVSKYRLYPVNNLKDRILTGITKFCHTCSQEKDSGYFDIHPKKYSNRYYECAICSRFRRLVMTFKAYNILGSKCAICGQTDGSKLSIDHMNGDGSIRRSKGEKVGFELCRKIIKGMYYSDPTC